MAERVISHYRILEKIGSGAMGEVFRARDERLGRDVALKLIKPASSANPDHLRRFELEARAAAALNHPNIVAIYDVGFDQGTPYIVCELLQGKTLRKCVAEGPLPVRLALDYAQQIVQGLIAAHDHRIVHRDLKPENLFVTTDGRIKILDFGVAKLQPGPDEGRSVEELTTVTKHGAVVGTVAYMSPEQLRAKAVDHRSDIFSVGSILYEMLTGCRAFHGETEVDTMTAVLREDPPELNLEQANVPTSCQQIMRHCLEKEPANRFQSARDLAFALSTIGSGGQTGRFKAPRSGTRMIPWASAAVLLVAALLLLANQLNRSPSSSPSYRRLTYERGTVFSARFAPGYRAIVYGASWNGRPVQLFSTVADSLLSQPLNLADANLLSISRGGELALALHGSHGAHLEMEGGMLARGPMAGGSPREVLADVSWADWSPSGDLAVVHHVQDSDRIEYPIGHVLYQSKGWISHLRVAPQGGRIAFMDHPSLWDDRGSVCMLDAGGKVHVLTPEWESEDGLAWSADGKEVWFTAVEKGISRDLHAVDMAGRIRTLLNLPDGMTLEDVSPDGGALVSVVAERLAMAIDQGDGKPVDLSWHDWNIAKDISPDGQSILFEDSSEAAGTNYSLAIRKIDGSPPVQLSEGSAGKLSPDGKWAISIVPGNPGQLKLIPMGAGQPRTIDIPGLNLQNGIAQFLGDGKRITFDASEPGHGVRTYVADLEGGKPIPITPEGVTGGLVSPDGRYIFRSNQAGVGAVYPTTGGGAPRVIPNLEPNFIPIQWSEDNASIYGYLSGQVPAKAYKVNVVTGKRILLRELQPEKSGVVTIAPVVVTRDGSRFAYSYYQVLSVLYLISGLH